MKIVKNVLKSMMFVLMIASFANSMFVLFTIEREDSLIQVENGVRLAVGFLILSFIFGLFYAALRYKK